MNWREHITADPAVLVGKPVLRGTRLAVEFVLGLIAQGWPEHEITRNYHITPEQVRACVACAQERLNDDHASLQPEFVASIERGKTDLREHRVVTGRDAREPKG